MRVKISASCLIAVFLAGSCAIAQTTVSVTPDSMATYGWSTETNQNATAEIANYGYAVAQRANPWTAEDGTSLGQGAYYATLDAGGWGGTTPPTAWLGLDKHNGQPLAGIRLDRITKLFYYALNAHFPSHSNNPDYWMEFSGYWWYQRQPIQLQITAQNADGTDRKQFWFLPFEPKGWTPTSGDWLRGDMCGRNTNKWIGFDCINFSNTTPNGLTGMAGYWYCPDPEYAYQSWAELIAQFGHYTLVPTSTYFDPTEVDPLGWKSAGSDPDTEPDADPSCTGTGKPINFEVGARKGNRTHLYFKDKVAWVTDFTMFRGYVDRFTLGINYGTPENPSIVQTTYNFEPSQGTPPPQVVCMSQKATYDDIITTIKDNQWRKFLVKFCGQVFWRRGNKCQFVIDDPYGPVPPPVGTVRIPQIVCHTWDGDAFAPSLKWDPTYIDEYWSIIGILERPIFQTAGDDRWSIWTHLGAMQYYYW